ncbi:MULTISPECIES: HTTM domain-containing protein [Streptomyces]|uniref:HTTM domain-containing protein n=1 Tax=Streptomyces ramulosus TaxID=47762 RepID=A0ABW1FJH7_9ACTN
MRQKLSSLVAGLDRLTASPAAVTGVSGTRALLGFVGFMFYASQYGERSYLFGPDSVYPWRDFIEGLHENGTFSLYALSTSGAWFDLLFHLGMLTALAVTLGVGGRPVLALHWVLLWSVYQRQPLILDGGDNLAWIVLPMLLLTRCYDRFSLSPGLLRRWSARVPDVVRAVSPALHNLGVAAIGVQICLVYLVSGLYKVQGKMWQDGTALFYVLRIPEFEWPGVSRLLYENDLLVIVGTYAATLFMVYFPVGILVPRLRPWAALGSIGLHVSIALFMGLTGFALTMVACDLIFLSGGIENLLRHARRAGGRAGRALRNRTGWPKAAVGPVTADGGVNTVVTTYDEKMGSISGRHEQAGRPSPRSV